jgi:tetratricopeptide (TPR) repeat protein/transcriptional regulator with XRE-family HTH domain
MIWEPDDDVEITGSEAAAVRSLHDLALLLRRLRRRQARQRGDSPLTYRELAAKTGWSHSSIGGYLKGQVLAPSDRFDALIQLLGATRAEQRALATTRDRLDEGRHVNVADDAPSASGTPAVLRALPAPPPYFTGRRAELDALAGLLHSRCDTVLISAIGGTAGVGKTSLALHWAHRIADRFPDGQIYMDLRGFGPVEDVMDPAEAIHCLLEAMQVPSHRMPSTLNGRTALYRSLLAGKRVLIVLDNARDTGQVRPLLPGEPTCLVVVTSRNLLSGLVATDGAAPLTVDLLTEDEARHLLAHRLGSGRVAAEPDAVTEIITHCARLPLALAVAAARIAASPGIQLATYAAELRDNHRRWAALAGDDPATDVRAVLSWSYHALNPATARLFRLLGLHAGPDLSVPAAASLCAVSEAEVQSLLADLTRAHLIAEQPPGRYLLHDLLRIYAAEEAGSDPEPERHAATRRILDHYLHSANAATRVVNAQGDPIPLDPPAPGVSPEQPETVAQALDWFTAEHPVLLATVRRCATAGFDSHTWHLVWAIGTYLERCGHWHEWLTAGHAALAAAQRAEDPGTLARVHRYLGRASMGLERLDDAQAHLRRALNLSRQLDDSVGQAHTHLELSNIAADRGHHTVALEHAQNALALYQRANHRQGQADALNSVGWYHALLGQYEQAIADCEQSLEVHQELGHGIVEATTWDSLGYAHHHLGHYDYAVVCYQRAVGLFQNLGARFDEAETLSRLGDTHTAAGRMDDARDAWRRAVAILDDIDHPEADRVRAKLRTPGTLAPFAADPDV